MVVDIVVTAVAGLVLMVAAVGTVYPVLPGSVLALATFVPWAWALGSSPAWIAAAISTLFAGVGWTASVVLTGRKLKRQRIPKRSVAVAVACSVVGMFVIPVVGLFVGFGCGLLVSEYLRRRNFGVALRSSMQTLKATGIGILVEFGMVCLASSVWTIGVVLHFVTR